MSGISGHAVKDEFKKQFVFNDKLWENILV